MVPENGDAGIDQNPTLTKSKNNKMHFGKLKDHTTNQILNPNVYPEANKKSQLDYYEMVTSSWFPVNIRLRGT